MVEIKVDIKDEEVRTLMKEVAGRLGNPKPALAVIGEIVHGSIQENFEEGGRPKGWKHLSQVTIGQRKRLNRWPGRILVRSGTAGGLMGSISYRALRDRVIWSANKVYARLHHFGAAKGSFGKVTANVPAHTRWIREVFGRPIEPKEIQVRAHTREMELPWGDIPARPFMLIQNKDWDEIREALGNFVVKGKKK